MIGPGTFAVVFSLLLCAVALGFCLGLLASWYGYRAGWYRRNLADSEKSVAAQALHDFMVREGFVASAEAPELPKKPSDAYPGFPASDPVDEQPGIYHDVPEGYRPR